MGIPPNKPGPNDAQMIYIPVAVFGVICPVLVALRVWSRLRKGGKLGADDYLILASLIFALASSGVEIASCLYGFGQHVYLLTPSNKANALLYFYICQATYKTSINLTKCSILMLYVRIFNNIRWVRIVCYTVTTIVATYCIASVTATIFQCQPIALAWNKSLHGTCISSQMFWFANAGFSVATDIIILCIPMPLVYSLQIPRIQKLALMVVFALGGFVVVTSCLRMTTINFAATTPDTTYDISSTMWTVIEMNVAIMCACLPMIRPLIVRIFPHLMPRSTGHPSHGGQRYAGGSHLGIPGGYGSHSHSSKGYFSSHSRSENDADADEWARVETKEGITMTNIRKGDQSSEEYILHEDRQAQPAGLNAHDGNGLVLPSARGSGGNGERGPFRNGMGIQKTVQYSVEYTKEKPGHDWA